ncbi:MAG: hypothetical protein QOG68_1491 [Solirubrobacteraceae bacterium]|jgi:hypothetical protein|nr:hypothetical protein [Solirubrobacteraceae bacterium]
MASREEEKRLRREERQAAEAAARASQNRAKRTQFLLGALLTIAVVVGAVVLVTGSGKNSGAKPITPTASNAADKIPAASERDLTKAAKAAGCVLLNPPLEGSSHVTTPVKYKSNPPTSGNHNPIPALDGIYNPGKEPTVEHLVHALEHGRIDFQYAPGTSAKLIGQLETLVSEPLNAKAGYKALLFRNDTKMPYAVAATAWGHLIGCKSADNPAIFDALRDFRVKYVDKGPEPGIPPTN